MRTHSWAGDLRIAASIITLCIGLLGFGQTARSAATGQPVAYAITPNNTLTVIDTGNHAVLNTITLAGPASYIVGTPDGKQLYVMGNDPTSVGPDGTNGVVWAISTQTNTVVATIPTTVFPVGMAISTDGSRVYASTSFSQAPGQVLVIDTATNQAVARINDTYSGGTGIAITPDGKHVYVPMLGGKDGRGGLDVIDTSTNALTSGLVYPAGTDFIQWNWAAVSPDSSKLYGLVFYEDSGGNPLVNGFIFSTTTNQVVGSAASGAAQLSTPLPGSSIIYGYTPMGSVAAFNTQTNAITATVPIASHISSLALTPNGKQLYVSNSNAQSIAVVDTTTNTVSGSIAVAGATGLAIIAAPPPLVLTPPGVTLQLSPTSVPPGAGTQLQWTSTGATSCTSSGAWSGSVALQGTASASFTAPGNYTFTLSCTGPGGMTSRSATLTVVSGSTLSFSATDVPLNGSVVVTWRAFAGATACQGADGWAGDLGTSGSKVVGPLQSVGTVKFTLQCLGPSGGQSIFKSISVFAPGALAYTHLTPPNNNVYALGTPGVAVPGGGLDGHGYAYDSQALQALPQPITALGQTFTLGSATTPSGISKLAIALNGARLSDLTLLVTAVNGNQLNQKFVVTYGDGTTATFTQSLTDWGTAGNFPGEDPSGPILMSDRITPTGAKQAHGFGFRAIRLTLDATKTATSLQLPANRNVIVLAVNETRTAQSSREAIAAAYNVTGLATVGHASSGGRLDNHGYAYDASLIPNDFSALGQQFTVGPADQPDAVSKSTITLPATTRLGLTVLATAVNAVQTDQTFIVTYQDGSTTAFTQSLSQWGAPQHYAGESIARTSASRITPAGTRQGGNWNVYAYSFQTDPTRKAVSLTLPQNRNVIVLAVNTITQ